MTAPDHPVIKESSGIMRALRWDGPGRLGAVDLPRPEPRAGWVRVDVAYTGLCGTDLHIVAGEHARARPGLVLGHEISGTLADPTADLAAGTPVVVNPLLPCGHCPTCLAGRPHICATLGLLGIDAPGGAAEQVLVPESSLVALPAGIDLARAAFAEPLAVAVRAVRRSGLTLGEDVLVVGAGPVGLAVALCARQAGAGSVRVVERAPARREAAAGLGFDVAQDAPDAAVPVVFDCAAHPAVAARLGALAEPGGRVVLVGVYPGVTPLDLQAVTFKELAVIGTRVYAPDDLATAARMIATGGFDPGPLITRTVGPDEAPAAIAGLASGYDVKVLVRGAHLERR